MNTKFFRVKEILAGRAVQFDLQIISFDYISMRYAENVQNMSFNAILWILCSGAAWRDLPKDCREYYLVEIDSNFCKVHQHVAGYNDKNPCTRERKIFNFYR